jgi:plastocyanin
MKTLAWIIIILLIAWGLYALLDKAPVTPVTTNNTNIESNSTTTINTASSTPVTPKTVTITYTDTGFSPKSIEINKGDTVKFVNNSSSGMWVASAMHPTHTVYDGTTLQAHCAPGATLSFDSCKSIPDGSSYSFTFEKIGTWGYHNHAASSFFGNVVVK